MEVGETSADLLARPEDGRLVDLVPLVQLEHIACLPKLRHAQWGHRVAVDASEPGEGGPIHAHTHHGFRTQGRFALRGGGRGADGCPSRTVTSRAPRGMPPSSSVT